MATVETKDLLPVHSRVSWSAILAGAVMALAVYLLLSVLGVALGLSVSGQVGDKTLGIGAATWAVVTILLSLFLGGCVTSQCTVGESKAEAITYGVIMWGVVFALLLWLMAGGVRIGFNAVMGVASTPAATAVANRLTDEDLRAAGFTPEQITTYRSQFDQLRARSENLPAEIRGVATDPRATAAAWWTFGGILLSMLAAVAGALVGSGPNLILAGLTVRSPVFSDRSRQEVLH